MLARKSHAREVCARSNKRNPVTFASMIRAKVTQRIIWKSGVFHLPTQLPYTGGFSRVTLVLTYLREIFMAPRNFLSDKQGTNQSAQRLRFSRRLTRATFSSNNWPWLHQRGLPSSRKRLFSDSCVLAAGAFPSHSRQVWRRPLWRPSHLRQPPVATWLRPPDF
jgi:hypothetical protein